MAACKNSKESHTENSPKKEQKNITTTVEVNNSKDNISWPGIYHGKMNCELPCRGIETTIILSEDGNYTYSYNELGIENGQQILNGEFKWDLKGRYISLQGNNFQDRVHYLVDQGRLRRMGDMKEELFTDKSAELDLMKLKNPVENTKWHLVEVDGQKISSENELNLSLTFEKGGKFFASGGCNSILGIYLLNGRNAIQFAQIISSEKACSFEHYDLQLIRALESTRSYIFANENELHLTIGKRAPFAKFMAIE